MNSRTQEFRIFQELNKNAHLKECFHQDSNCSSKIIRAHSIQNNRILNKISRNGEVLNFSEAGDNNEIKLSRIGRKKATTFTGFCGYHDNAIFVPIESTDYKERNHEQEFLFAYRALAKEYHAKKWSIKLLQETINKLSNDRALEKLSSYLAGATASLAQLNFQREMFNSFLGKRDFDIISTRIIKFHEEYHIAVSSAFTVEKDFNGNSINNFSDLETHLKYIYLSVFPQNGKTYVLLSYLRKNKKFFSAFMNKIFEKSVNEKKITLSNIIAIHVENFAFSPIRWERISEAEKSEFQSLFRTTLFLPGDSMNQFKNINLFI
jgi:hypothetical protein